MATGSTPRDLCVCCGNAVVRSNSRRRVAGTSSKLVLPVFVELYEKVFPGKSFLPPDFSENSRLFWCRPCFAKLEKLLKLRKDAQELENQISSSVQSVGTLFMQNPISSITLTPKKRGLSSPHNSKRRRHYDTPERQVLSRTVVTGSPSVSVRLHFLFDCLDINIWLHQIYAGSPKTKERIFSCLCFK